MEEEPNDRKALSKQITHLQQVKASLVEQDSSIASLIQEQIDRLKKQVTESKPLENQLRSLQAALERRKDRIAEINLQVQSTCCTV